MSFTPHRPFIARFRVMKFRVEAAGVAWSFSRSAPHLDARLELICHRCSRSVYARHAEGCGRRQVVLTAFSGDGAIHFNWGALTEERLSPLLDDATSPRLVPALDPLARAHIRSCTAAILVAVSDMMTLENPMAGQAHVERMVDGLRADAVIMGLPW